MKVELYLVSFACLSLIVPAIFTALRKKFSKTAFRILLFTVICLLASTIALRIAKYGMFTLRNTFDILIIISLLISTGLQFFLTRDSRFYIITALFLFILILCSVPFLPETAKAKNLPPILRSPYFYLHIPAYIIAYALLLIAFIISLHACCLPSRYIQYSKYISRYMKASFWFMNLGIILGALWAEQAWGNFWTWDIKENLSLAILFSQSLYFHTGNNRKTSFLIIALTTSLVIVNLLGINLLKRGLHVY